MAKYCKILISVVLVLILVLFSACQNLQDISASTEPIAEELLTYESGLEALHEVPNVPYVQTVTVPYRQVLDPVLIGNTLYMAVAKPDRSETDTNRLVAYDIETGKERLLFTSTQEEAMMQFLQTDGKWLIWMDLALQGGECNIYMMDMETQKITRVNHFSSTAPSYTTPILMNGKIYWMEEENVTGEGDNLSIYGHIYYYDCQTQKKSEIAEMHNIWINNLNLSAKDGKVVWFERLDDLSAYYIYDVETGKMDTIPAKQRDAMNIQYVDGYIFASETENFKEQTPKQMVCINTRTKEYTELMPGFHRFDLSENYLVGSSGSVVWFYSRTGNTLEILPEIACSDFSDYNITPNDEILIVENNEGINETPFTGLKDEITVRIYKLSERS